MNNYNFELLERENKQLYESVDFNIAKILKKYNTSMYKYFTMFLASNKTNNYCGEKVYNYLYNLYLNSLTKDDLKELKFLNKQINRLKKKIEFEFLATFTETSIIDVPPMQNNELVINLSDKIILRDSEGFYSNINHVQNKIDNESVVFNTMNSYLINKEEIMGGKRSIKSKVLNRKEVLFVANYLGYGSIRDNTLTNQKRKNEKNLVKTKEL